MNGLGNEPDADDGAAATTEITRKLVNQLRPFIIPNKLQQAEQELGLHVVQELYQEFHQGPLPSPRQLGAYESALPGAAERIMTMAEGEQAHRHECERRLISGEITLKHLGQIFALIALLVMIGLVGYMVFAGYPVQAAALGSVMITGVVGLFLAPKFFHRTPEAPPNRTPKQQSRRKGR